MAADDTTGTPEERWHMMAAAARNMTVTDFLAQHTNYSIRVLDGIAHGYADPDSTTNYDPIGGPGTAGYANCCILAIQTMRQYWKDITTLPAVTAGHEAYEEEKENIDGDVGNG